jgi:N-acetylmuramoyl-L-alanine amidase
MKIQNHLLFGDDGKQVAFVGTPNVGKGKLSPRFLVMHFTAGGSAKESIGWLKNPEAKASAHIVIDKDGTITQMVPFDKVAWHAGKSAWAGINGLNSFSIGIELDNPGRLTKKGGQWVSDPGRKYPASEVLVATHKNESEPSGWYKYPKAQLDAALAVAKAIAATYKVEDVIGHDDISPGRKVDPGPAFPMADFRAATLAAKTAAAAAPAKPAATTPATPAKPAATTPAATTPAKPAATTPATPAKPATPVATTPAATTPAAPAGAFFRVTTSLKIRGGPGVQHEPVAGSPLPAGTILQGFEDKGEWKRVKVEGSVNHVLGVAGWVAAKYLEATVPAMKIAGEPSTAGV